MRPGRSPALNYSDYSGRFLSPSISLMVKSGLWIELYAAVGFLVGLGLSSLMGQRTVPVILMIVLEIVLTPLLSHSPITHLVNLQRALVGIAVTHIEPGGLPSVFGGPHNGVNGPAGVTESTTVAICVVVGWVAGVVGARRLADGEAGRLITELARSMAGVPRRRERDSASPCAFHHPRSTMRVPSHPRSTMRVPPCAFHHARFTALRK